MFRIYQHDHEGLHSCGESALVAVTLQEAKSEFNDLCNELRELGGDWKDADFALTDDELQIIEVNEA